MSTNIQVNKDQDSSMTLFEQTCEVAQNVLNSSLTKASLVTGSVAYLGLTFIGPMALVSLPLTGYLSWSSAEATRLQVERAAEVKEAATELRRIRLIKEEETPAVVKSNGVFRAFYETATRTSICIRWTVMTCAVVVLSSMAYVWRDSLFNSK